MKAYGLSTRELRDEQKFRKLSKVTEWINVQSFSFFLSFFKILSYKSNLSIFWTHVMSTTYTELIRKDNFLLLLLLSILKETQKKSSLI